MIVDMRAQPSGPLRRFFSSLSVAAALGVSLGAQAPAARTAGVAPEVGTRVDAVFARWNSTATPGCSVGVSRGGQPVLARAYGMADLEHAVPNTPDTVFEAGSVAKQFVAAAVLQLARSRKLSLDDPARTYLPELPDYGAPITVRQLLQHTSGLRDWGAVAALGGWPRHTRAYTHAHVLDIVSRQRALNFNPGDSYSYTNTGYNLAAILASRVSRMSFADYTRDTLFRPLGMTRTGWRDDFTAIVKDRAIAYTRTEQGWRMQMPFENVHGNGGLLTTVDDLLAWNENFVHGRVGGPEFARDMLQPARLNDGRDIEYALGLFATTWRGIREIHHPGATAGYRAFLARYPDQHVSVAVLCNADDADAASLGRQVAELFLDRLSTRSEINGVRLVRAVLDARAGLYRNVATGDALTLVVDGEGLRVPGGRRFIPLSQTRFQSPDGALMEFDIGTNGRPRGFNAAWSANERHRFEPTAKASPTPAQMRELEGSYTSAEVETAFTVFVEKNTLKLRQRPDREWTLRPLYADAYWTPLALVRFIRDAEGRVIEMSLGVSRARDVRFARMP